MMAEPNENTDSLAVEEGLRQLWWKSYAKPALRQRMIQVQSDLEFRRGQDEFNRGRLSVIRSLLNEAAEYLTPDEEEE